MLPRLWLGFDHDRSQDHVTSGGLQHGPDGLDRSLDVRQCSLTPAAGREIQDQQFDINPGYRHIVLR
jgi:hypothetical protein